MAIRYHRRWAGLVVAPLAFSCPTLAAGAEFAGSMQGSFTYRVGDDIAFDLNTMNRGDNPFSSIRTLTALRAQVNETVSLYLEIPFDAGANSSLYTTYLRPFVRLTSLGGAEQLNFQAGRLPTVFGTYGERSSSTESGVFSVPLLYFYHTAARGDIVPAGPDYFFQPGIRGGGYQAVNNGIRTSYVGMPPLYDSCWDVGAEVYGSSQGIQYSLAATQGTISRPAMLGSDFNDGKGVVGRLGYQFEDGALFGLRLGISGGIGPYLSETVETDPTFPPGAEIGDFQNTGVGADLSFARGPWQIFSEVGQIRYEVPNVSPTLSLVSYFVEIVRDLGPSFSLGARQEAILFNDITSSTGVTEGWDYDVWRWEAAVNYRFALGTRLRLGYQWTRVPDDPELDGQLLALQLQAWTR